MVYRFYSHWYLIAFQKNCMSHHLHYKMCVWALWPSVTPTSSCGWCDLWPLSWISLLSVVLNKKHFSLFQCWSENPPPPFITISWNDWSVKCKCEWWCSTPLYFQFGGGEKKNFCTFTIRNSLKTPRTHRNLFKSLYFCCMKSVWLIKSADGVTANVHRLSRFTADGSPEKKQSWREKVSCVST